MTVDESGLRAGAVRGRASLAVRAARPRSRLWSLQRRFVLGALLVLPLLAACAGPASDDSPSREVQASPSVTPGEFSPPSIGTTEGQLLVGDARYAALRVAQDIMRTARYCALITRDAAGESIARTIDPSPPDSEMVVRFVTNPRSRKVVQLAADPRVSLHYLDAAAQRYTTLYGRARLVVDSAARRRLWYDGWNPFYPARELDANMYEVIPERLEVVSPGDGVIGDSTTWATPTVRFAPIADRP